MSARSAPTLRRATTSPWCSCATTADPRRRGEKKNRTGRRAPSGRRDTGRSAIDELPAAVEIRRIPRRDRWGGRAPRFTERHDFVLLQRLRSPHAIGECLQVDVAAIPARDADDRRVGGRRRELEEI